jgi:hypothetical protein
MWNSIFLQIGISIFIIFCIHHLYIYCKTNFSTQKTKDIVAIHTQKYNDILNQIQESNAREKAELINKFTHQVSENYLPVQDLSEPHLSESDLHNMQKEMEAFIQETQI